MALPNILITGTPGTGKTTLSRLLEDAMNNEYGIKYTHIPLGEWINEKKLYKHWNEEFNVPEFDEDLICDELEPMVPHGGMIVDFHSSAFFPQHWFKYVVLLRVENTQLYDRLAERGYEQKKITENIECEIMEVTHDEVEEAYRPEQIMERVNNVTEDMNTILDELKSLLVA